MTDLSTLIARTLDANILPLSECKLLGLPVKRLPFGRRKTMWPEEHFHVSLKQEPYITLREQHWSQQ